MRKTSTIKLEHVYNLPEFTMVEFQNRIIAIAVDLGKWIILENECQREILQQLCDKRSIGEVLSKFPENQKDIIDILTQIEAKHILKTCKLSSIFQNNRLHLHVTNQCNLRCPHCYMASGVLLEDELTTDEIKKLCFNFHQYGGKYVSLTGGEPRTRKDFFDIVKYISDLGMRVAIYTNGCLWSEIDIQRLSQYNIEGIQISIDGFDEKTNATIRGKGSFERALATLDLIVKYDIKAIVAVTPSFDLLRNNTKNYVCFANELIKKYGREKVRIDFSYGLLPGRNLTKNDILNFKQEYYQLIDKVVRGVYEDAEQTTFVSNIKDDTIFDGCGYGSLNVVANGDFYFCDRLSDAAKIGNIREMRFEKIYDWMKKAEDLAKIDNLKPCAQCELKYICGGGCRAEFFPGLIQMRDFDNIENIEYAPRICTIEEKHKIYDLMVKANKRFYI